MGANSAIEWTDHTFNPWWGCRRVSPACDNCYAAAFSKRVGSVSWDSGEYRTFGDQHWRQPLNWDRELVRAGKRARVFCASMADVFDAEAPHAERQRLWSVMRQTTNIDWLLLTKRAKLALDYLPADLCERPDVWIGCTAETLDLYRQRVGMLRQAGIRTLFVSMEPLIDAVPITLADLAGVGWVIVGGETGHGARPMYPNWVRHIRDVCRVAGVPFFFKQWGDWGHDPDLSSEQQESEEIAGRYRFPMRRVGKKAAGRLLDGRTWDELPNV